MRLTEKQLRSLKAKPVRTCITLHECCLCAKDITYGNDYHDGGYGRRAHVGCVRATESSLEPSQENAPAK